MAAVERRGQAQATALQAAAAVVAAWACEWEQQRRGKGRAHSRYALTCGCADWAAHERARRPVVGAVRLWVRDWVIHHKG